MDLWLDGHFGVMSGMSAREGHAFPHHEGSVVNVDLPAPDAWGSAGRDGRP